jgi:hypothetical protein
MLPSSVVQRRLSLGKCVITKDDPEGQQNDFLQSLPKEYVLFDYEKEPIQKDIDDWFRKVYPDAFLHGRNRVFVPKFDRIISTENPSALGMHINYGNHPTILSRMDVFSQAWGRACFFAQPNEIIKLRTQVGIHERWHGVHGTVFYQQLRAAYSNPDIQLGLDELLTYNNIHNFLNKFIPPDIYTNCSGFAECKMREDQRRIIDYHLLNNSDLKQTQKALSDLLQVVHPMIGVIMNFDPQIRQCLQDSLDALANI